MAELSRGQLLKSPEVLGIGTTSAEIKMFDADESAYVILKAPDVVGTAYSFTFPINPGTDGYYLKTDGVGITTWSALTVTAAGSVNQIQYNSAGNFAGAAVTTDGTNLYVSSAAQLRFNDSDNSNYVGFAASSTVAANRSYILPDTIGSVGQVLKIASSPSPTATSASLIWANDDLGESGNPGGLDTYVQFNDGGLFGGDAGLTYNSTTDILSVTGAVNVATGGDYRINNTSVLNATTLGTGVVNSSLTSVGTLGSLQVDNVNINGNVISSTDTNGNIDLDPNGTGFVRVLGDAPLRLMDEDNSNYVAFSAPASVTSDYTLTLPAAGGADNEVLQYNSAGIGSFVANTRTLNFVIDGVGSVISTGVKGVAILDADYTLTAWTIYGDSTGAINVDVGRAAEPTYPRVSGATFTTIVSPNLTAGQVAARTAALGIGITFGDTLQFNVTSNTGSHTRVTVALRLVPR